MRVGQWPTETTPNPSASSIALETHNAIRRTGTDLQNEEADMGTVRTRTNSKDNTQAEDEAARSPQPQDPPSLENLVVTEARRHLLSRDYYRFEWFRILIGMIILLVSEIIISVLVRLGDIVTLWQSVFNSVAIGLASLFLYTGFFVLLGEHHEAMKRAVEKYARLSPRLQRTCLRFCAYAFSCSVIAAVAYISSFAL